MKEYYVNLRDDVCPTCGASTSSVIPQCGHLQGVWVVDVYQDGYYVGDRQYVDSKNFVGSLFSDPVAAMIWVDNEYDLDGDTNRAWRWDEDDDGPWSSCNGKGTDVQINYMEVLDG